MKPSNHCEFSSSDFSATAIETSDSRIVHVYGSGLCPTGGWELRLAAANPGVVPHPGTLWLELHERQPRRGLRTSTAPTTTTVDAIIEDSSAERIEIRFGWRDGFVVPVRTAVDGRPTRRRPGERADAATRRVAASARAVAIVG
ncbi:MAG TPA: hypothetical protein VFG92_06030 [Agromyces sp.]|nr:hypothetical protein [Agromyces sp.]